MVQSCFLAHRKGYRRSFLTVLGVLSLCATDVASVRAAPLSFATAYRSIPFPDGRVTSLATGDVNNDSIPDLVVGTNDDVSGGTWILRGRGDFTFSNPVRIGGSADRLELVDLDQDGNLDIVVIPDNGISRSGSIAIALGHGDGTFGPWSGGDEQGVPVSFAVGDLNHDGREDLVVSVYLPYHGYFVTRLGSGDGTFGPAVKTTLDGWPGSVCTADFTGDGNLDVEIAIETSPVQVYPGDGTGAFGNAISQDMGPNVRRLAAADLNRDGWSDLVALDIDSYPSTDHSVHVRLANPGGTLGSSSSYPVLNQPYDMSIADLDGDGALDVAALGHSVGAASVLLNDGHGVFRSRLDTGTGLGTLEIAAADFDHDGRVDLAGVDSHAVNIFPGNGDGTFGLDVENPIGGPASRLWTLDADHDAHRDVLALLTGSGNGHPSVLLGQGNGRFGPVVPSDVPFNVQSLATGDLNEDGLPDLVIGDAPNGADLPGHIAIMLGESGGAFRVASSLGGGNGARVSLEDLDLDGHLDLIANIHIRTSTLPSVNRYETSVSLGNGNGAFQAPRSLPLALNADFRIARLDDDGEPDLVAFGDSIVYLLGDGHGGFRRSGGISADDAYAALADLNQDGRDDVAFIRLSGGSDKSLKVVLTGPNGGPFGVTPTELPSSSVDLLSGDFDNDGLEDLAVLGTSLYILRGLGGGNLAAPQSFAVGGSPTALAAGDFNGDSRLDLVVANSIPRTVTVLLNTGSEVPPPPVIVSVDPNRAPVGDFVTIAGDHLFGATRVEFGGKPATHFTTPDDRHIQAKVPDDARDGSVTVISRGGVATSSASFRVTPLILGIHPASGHAGEIVTLSGTSFTRVTAVRFGAVTASFSVLSDTIMTASVPRGSRKGRILVDHPNGLAQSPVNFDVLPAIFNFDPLGGPPETIVRIVGDAFFDIASVRIGTSPTRFEVVSDSLIEAVVPPDAVTSPLTVVTRGGTEASSDRSFEIGPANGPRIGAMTPSHGRVGEEILILGGNLLDVASVEFNRTSAEFLIRSADSLPARVPRRGTSGPVVIRSRLGMASNAVPFRVAATIRDFEPDSGGPGAHVHVHGLTFTGVLDVTIGGISAAFTVISDSELVATVPDRATSGKISLVMPDVSTESDNVFTVITPFSVTTSGPLSFAPPSPNPTRAGLSLTYSLGSPGSVSFEVVDTRGARITRLDLGPIDAGPHQIEWSGRDQRGRRLPAGVYFLRLSVPGHAVTRRACLLE